MVGKGPDIKLEGETFKFTFLCYVKFYDLLNIPKTSKPKDGGEEFWSNEVRLEDNIFQFKVETSDNSNNYYN